jgi:hypothetical protein
MSIMLHLLLTIRVMSGAEAFASFLRSRGSGIPANRPHPHRAHSRQTCIDVHKDGIALGHHLFASSPRAMQMSSGFAFVMPPLALSFRFGVLTVTAVSADRKAGANRRPAFLAVGVFGVLRMKSVLKKLLDRYLHLIASKWRCGLGEGLMLSGSCY